MKKVLFFLQVLFFILVISIIVGCGDDSYLAIFLVENQYTQELKEVNVYVFDSMKSIPIPNAILSTPLPTLRNELAKNSKRNQKIRNVAVNSISPEIFFEISFGDIRNTKTYFVLIETSTGEVMSSIFTIEAFVATGILGWSDYSRINKRIIINKDGKIIL